MLKILLTILALLIITNRYRAFKSRIIQGKLKNIEISPEEFFKLDFLASRCKERAKAAGISIPKKNFAVIQLENDPYTWVILRLGIVDTELFRCRMSIDDVSEASTFAKKEIEREEKKEEGV